MTTFILPPAGRSPAQLREGCFSLNLRYTDTHKSNREEMLLSFLWECQNLVRTMKGIMSYLRKQVYYLFDFFMEISVSWHSICCDPGYICGTLLL